MIQFNFNTCKSAQAAAILLKLHGGDMDKYLLIKMLYLADRESLEKWEESITGDVAVSMQYGPVLSHVYDLTKGDCYSAREEWEPFISNADEQTNRISLLNDPGDSELSKSEIKILQHIHEKFKTFEWKQMRDYCHNLSEYENISEGSKKIPIERILEAVGKSKEQISEAEKRFHQIRMAEALLTD